MKREYYVVTRNAHGCHCWTAYCSGFWPFERVSNNLIRIWQKYSADYTGLDCVVINFIRIKERS